MACCHQRTVITVRNVVGKVMFLHLSVSHSVHGGGVSGTPGQTPLPRAETPPPGRHPPPATTAADGMHPTGMLSCYDFVFLSVKLRT